MLVTASHNQPFKLSAPICNVPAGATGQLKRLDSYHVALTFDNRDHEDLVFDITDPDPEVRAAMHPLLHTVSPSMTDPPRYRSSWRQLAVAAVLAVVLFESFQHTSAYAQVLDEVAEVSQFIPELLFGS